MSFKVGDTVSDTKVVTEEMIQLFAKLSGDYNPVHMDEAHAKTTRFGKRIAHGMISGALISSALANKLGEGGIYLSQSMKFLKPVFIGDTLTVTINVLSLKESNGIASLATNVTNQSGELVVKGDAMIMRGDKV